MNLKSHLKLYYAFWLIILILNTIIYVEYKSQKTFDFYFVFTFLFSAFINGLEGHRLSKHIRNHNKEQYLKNKSFRGVDGVYNGFSAFGFLFSNNDLDDKVLDSLKSNYKKALLLIFFIFCSYPILLFLWN